jgi:chorismate synthase
LEEFIEHSLSVNLMLKVANLVYKGYKGVGCVIDGFPSQFKVSIDKIQQELNRRKPGQSSITTPRKENDLVECLSGL